MMMMIHSDFLVIQDWSKGNLEWFAAWGENPETSSTNNTPGSKMAPWLQRSLAAFVVNVYHVRPQLICIGFLISSSKDLRLQPQNGICFNLCTKHCIAFMARFDVIFHGLKWVPTGSIAMEQSDHVLSLGIPSYVCWCKTPIPLHTKPPNTSNNWHTHDFWIPILMASYESNQEPNGQSYSNNIHIMLCFTSRFSYTQHHFTN